MERLRVTLVAPPWQSLAHPALSVAALKSAADEHEVGIYYGYLRFAEWVLLATDGRLTPDLINDVSQSGFDVLAGEWVFSSVLYGVGHNADTVLPRLAEAGLDSDQLLELHALAPAWTEQAAAEIAACAPDVVALTTTFMGLMPALAIASRVQALRPGVHIVLGGAACDGPMGVAVHRNFGLVDFVIRGEGELPFSQLLGHLAGSAESGPGTIAGLCWRDQDGRSISNTEPHALTKASSFGPPDHSGYFAHLATSPLAGRLSPVLLLESSRGCWWGQKQHCTFCGLNDLTIGYRARTGQDARGMILTAVENTQTLDITFTDNIIDRSYYTTLLPSLAEADLDLKLFYEIKANITTEQAHALRAAGVLAVQPGIESLHSHPLRLMNKGSTGAVSVTALRNLNASGVAVYWNYLYGFPGETDSDYLEVIEQLPNLVHLSPPGSVTRIVLERFNPYFTGAQPGFADRSPNPMYGLVFDLPPSELCDLAYLWRAAPAGIDDTTAAALAATVEAWRRDVHTSVLTHLDRGEHLYIYDRRAGRGATDYVLDGDTARLYRRLSSAATAEQAAASLEIELGSVRAAIGDLYDRGLLFRDADRYVSLSTPFDAAQVRRPVTVQTLMAATE